MDFQHSTDAEETPTSKDREPLPEPPEDGGPDPDDQVNLTDEESRIMHTSENGYQQAYNAQATVCTGSHLILAGHISQKSNDKQELEPALRPLSELPEKVGSPDRLAADSGHYSLGNAQACEDRGICPYISAGREEHNQAWKERFSEPEGPPEKENGLEAMAHRLETREGKAFYGRRKGTVEPIFGIIKEVLGIRQFLLRGLKKVKGEWALIRCAFNLKRMHRLAGEAA